MSDAQRCASVDAIRRCAGRSDKAVTIETMVGSIDHTQ